MQRKSSNRSAPRTTRSATSLKTRTAASRKKATVRQSAAAVSAPQIDFRSRQPQDDAYIVHLTEEQLGAIHEQAFQEPFPREQFLRYLESGAPTFIVERNKKRIGYFSYLLGPEARMHISAMVIEPQHQSDGVGTAVMKRLEADAVSQGVQVLEVFVQSNNVQSLAFTRKLGFREAYQVTPTTICFQKWIGQVPAPMQPPLAAAQNPAAYW